VFDTAEDEVEKVEIDYPGGSLTLPLAKIFTDTKFIASITRAKTHDTVVTTLAIKNLLVGAIHGGFSSRFDIHQGNGIHWIMTEIAKHTYPNLALIDGTLGMQGRGPGSGDPIKAGWLTASLDPLACDSLTSYLMGFDIKDIGYLNLLRDENFGKLYPEDEIEIIGPDPSKLVTKFRPHPTFSSQRLWRK
jgi:uncharacterized protein (DUF362 family)